MLRTTLSLIGLALGLFTCFSGARCFADVVSKPTRLYGLGDSRVVVVSPDHRYLASAGQGGAFLWDFQTGTLLHRLETEWSVTALEFSPDGETLLGASRSTIFAWETESGRQKSEFLGHTTGVFDLKFAADGLSFVSSGSDNSARIWSLESGAVLHMVTTPGEPVNAAALSPDGRLLVTLNGSPINGVKIWDIATETQLRFLAMTNWFASQLLFTADGRLVTAASDRTVSLWDIETAQRLRSFSGLVNSTFSLALWASGPSAISVLSNDGQVNTWNLETGESLHVTPGEPTITAAGVPGAFQAVGANVDFVLRLRETSSGATLRSFAGHTASTFSAVAFSPDGRYVLGGGTEEATRLWDRQTGALVRNFKGTGSGTMAGAFSPDGSNVLTTVGLPNPAAQLWKTETGELLREFKWTGSWTMCAAFSKSGHRIAAGAQDARLRIFDTTNGALVRTLVGTGWITAAGFSPNTPRVLGGASDARVYLFNYETGQLLHTFFFDAGRVVASMFSPDGGTLLIAWTDGVLHLYDATTFELRRELFFMSFLDSATFSPDGQYVLTGEGWPLFTASIRAAETLKPLRTFAGHKWTPSAVAFSSDGASILTAGELVREWSVPDLAARLRVQGLPDHLRLTWSFGQLEHASSLDGPWEPVNGATSPFEVELGGLMDFYRVRASE